MKTKDRPAAHVTDMPDNNSPRESIMAQTGLRPKHKYH